MAANSGTSTTPSTSRARLPLTPRVTSSRRGGHAPIRSQTAERQSAAPATPAMHLTPDVLIAPRGNLSIEEKGRSFAKVFETRALDMRRLRL
jgi:hypothetical protein